MTFTYYTDNKKTVVAVSSLRGKRYKGIAKCSPEDSFDLEYGKRLAAAKCEVVARTDEMNNRALSIKCLNDLKNEIQKDINESFYNLAKACDRLHAAKSSLEKILEEKE